MVLIINCPECGKTNRVADSATGELAKCRHCRAVVVVPEPTPETEDHTEEPPLDPPHNPLAFAKRLLPSALSAEAAPEHSPTPPDDSSYGLASLYLATLSFLLFFTPALLAGMTGAIGASIAFFAGIFVSFGCFTFCRHGYRLAQEAENHPQGRGYAVAGKLVNKFFLRFYILAIVFFIVGAVVTLFYAKQATGQIQDQLKGLDQLKDIGKVLDGLK